MKFGCMFTEYLQEEREWLMDENCAHIKYDRLKNVLKSCQNYKDGSSDDHHQSCECQSCPVIEIQILEESGQLDKYLLEESGLALNAVKHPLMDSQYFAEEVKVDVVD